MSFDWCMALLSLFPVQETGIAPHDFWAGEFFIEGIIPHEIIVVLRVANFLTQLRFMEGAYSKLYKVPKQDSVSL